MRLTIQLDGPHVRVDVRRWGTEQTPERIAELLAAALVRALRDNPPPYPPIESAARHLPDHIRVAVRRVLVRHLTEHHVRPRPFADLLAALLHDLAPHLSADQDR